MAAWQAFAPAVFMLSAFVSVTGNVPATAPTLPGTVQPPPSLVWVVTLSAATSHAEWPASTEKPPVPWAVSRPNEETNTGDGFGLDTVRTTLVCPPGARNVVGDPGLRVIATVVPVPPPPDPDPGLLQNALAEPTTARARTPRRSRTVKVRPSKASMVSASSWGIGAGSGSG